jgi:hypothetical protein
MYLDTEEFLTVAVLVIFFALVLFTFSALIPIIIKGIINRFKRKDKK